MAAVERNVSTAVDGIQGGDHSKAALGWIDQAGRNPGAKLGLLVTDWTAVEVARSDLCALLILRTGNRDETVTALDESEVPPSVS